MRVAGCAIQAVMQAITFINLVAINNDINRRASSNASFFTKNCYLLEASKYY